MCSVEGGEVGRQENQPQEGGGGHRDEDEPRLVEVLGEFTGEKAVEGADQDEEEVEGQRRDETREGQAT